MVEMVSFGGGGIRGQIIQTVRKLAQDHIPKVGFKLMFRLRQSQLPSRPREAVFFVLDVSMPSTGRLAKCLYDE